MDMVDHEEVPMKKIFCMVSIVVVMSIFMGNSFLFSQKLTSGKAKLSGSVVDETTGKPIEGVKIKMVFAQEQAVLEPFPVTDAEGKWKAVYIRNGRWDIDFIKDGYELKQITAMTGATTPIDIKLKKMEGTQVSGEVMKELEGAKKLMEQKQFDAAIAEFIKAEEKYKGTPGAEMIDIYLGNCYSLKGDYAKSIEYYKKLLEKFPTNKEILVSIGNAYNNLNDGENALAWFSKLSIDDISSIDSLYNIGVIYYNKNDMQNALKYFKKVVEIDNTFADGYYQVGMTYTALNQPKEAVEALKKFIELDPKSPNAEAAQSIIDAFK